MVLLLFRADFQDVIIISDAITAVENAFGNFNGRTMYNGFLFYIVIDISNSHASWSTNQTSFITFKYLLSRNHSICSI